MNQLQAADAKHQHQLHVQHQHHAQHQHDVQLLLQAAVAKLQLQLQAVVATSFG